MNSNASPQPGAPAEAARYALLRRLAPSMRHHLVVNLQPIGMVYEVLDRRLRVAVPNIAEVQESAQKINGFARAALGSALDVVTWLAPEQDAAVDVSDGVRECLSLIATSFTFRGYAVRNEVPAVQGEVPRAAMRCVLTSALIHLTDENAGPAVIHLSAQESAAGLALVLSLQAIDGDQGFSTAPAYRTLTWADVQALAEADGVAVTREGERVVRINLPWVGVRG